MAGVATSFGLNSPGEIGNDHIPKHVFDNAPGLTGEQKLALAMIQSAIADAIGIVVCTDAAKREANSWINNDDGGEYSFVELCDMLGMNPSYIRRKIHEDTPRRAQFRAVL